MEQFAANEIMGGLDRLPKVFPKLRSLIAPIITTGYSKQDEKLHIELQPIPKTPGELWHTSISINSQILQLDKENDGTYTIINVPR